MIAILQNIRTFADNLTKLCANQNNISHEQTD